MVRKRILLVNCYKRAGSNKIAAYRQALERAAQGLALAPDFLVVNDRQLPAAGKAFDLAVISGSYKMVGDEEYTPELADFMRRNRQPLLGICYGHQILARALGAEVVKDKIYHDGDEEVFLRAGSGLFAGFPQRFPMRQSHYENVLKNEKLYAQFQVLAENENGQVEAIGHRVLPLFGVQFHPERSPQWGDKIFFNFMHVAIRQI